MPTSNSHFCFVCSRLLHNHAYRVLRNSGKVSKLHCSISALGACFIPHSAHPPLLLSTFQLLLHLRAFQQFQSRSNGFFPMQCVLQPQHYLCQCHWTASQPSESLKIHLALNECEWMWWILVVILCDSTVQRVTNIRRMSPCHGKAYNSNTYVRNLAEERNTQTQCLAHERDFRRAKRTETDAAARPNEIERFFGDESFVCVGFVGYT